MNNCAYKIISALWLVLFFCWLYAEEIYVVNAGHPGDNTSRAMVRIDRDVLSFKPQMVVVVLGTNDAFNPNATNDINKFRCNLRQLVMKLKKGDVKYIVLASPPPVNEAILRRRSPKLREIIPANINYVDYIKQYARAVKEIADSENVIFFDLFDLINADSANFNSKSSLLRNRENSHADDGVHFTVAGNHYLGKALASFLCKYLKRGGRVVCFGDSITYGVHVKGAGTITGQCYPAVLWRYLNSSLVNAGKGPSLLSGIVNVGNHFGLVANGSFEDMDEVGFPINWIMKRKDKDHAVIIRDNAIAGNYFLRLVCDSKTPAFIRSKLNNIVAGKYCFQLKVRGKGTLTIGYSVYHPVRHYEIKKVQLSNEWEQIENIVTIPQGITQFCVWFRASACLDIDDVVFCASNAKKTNLYSRSLSDRDFSIAFPVRQAPSELFVNSKTLKISFASLQAGAVMTSVSNTFGKEFINYPPARGLWQIRLKNMDFNTSRLPDILPIACDPEMDDGTIINRNGESDDDLCIDATSAMLLGASSKVKKITNGLCFTWTGIDIGKEKGVLDVTITVKKSESGGIIFDGNFENRSRRFTVFYFAYPQVDGLGKINGNPEQDYLATPHYLGRLIRNPASGRLLNRNRLFRSNNSGHSMHFDALYSEGDGLFFGVWDSEQNAKRWNLETSSINGLSYAVFHIPDNMKAYPQRYSTPYSVELLCFTGDWYDACQIYRNWAIQQSWCSAGKISRRRGKDIPKWFLDMTNWIHISVANMLKGHRHYVERYFKDFKEYKTGIWLTHWGVDNLRYDFPNPDRFPLTELDKQAIAEISMRQLPVSGYIQLTGWTRSMNSFKKAKEPEKHLLRNFYGQILSWGGSGYRADSMLVYPGILWRKVMRDFISKMAQSGFNVAYLDSGNHGGSHLNFTPECSSSCGGGSDYVKSNQQLLKLLRDTGREINPEFCITTESFWEGNLNYLDAVLCVNSPSMYLEGERVTAIPLGPAVYNDYAVLFGTLYGRGDLKGNAKGVITKTAQSLLWGIMPGWELPHAMYSFDDPDRVRRTSLQRMQAFNKGRKYLQYGKMLRAPKILDSGNDLMIPWGIGWSERTYQVKTQAILATAYRAEDKSLGVILYNLDEKPRRIKVDCQDIDFVFKNRKFRVIYPADIKISTDGNLLLDIMLPAQCPVIIEGQ